MDIKPRDTLISLGAAFYWADCLLILSNFAMLGIFMTSQSLLITNLGCYVSLSCIAIIGPRLHSQLNLNVLAGIALCLSLTSGMGLFICYGLSLTNIEQYSLIAGLIHGLGLGILLQLWSLRFTTIGVRNAIFAVTATVFLACALFFIAINMPPPMLIMLHGLFPASSSLFSFLIKDEGFNERLTSRTARPSQWRGFWIIRTLYGFGIGALLALSRLPGHVIQVGPAAESFIGGIGLLLLVLLVAVFITKRAPEIKAYWLPCVPIVAIVLFLILTIGSDSSILTCVAIISSWICFMVLSSVQISNFRMLFGMSAASIAFREKVAVTTVWNLALLAGALIADFVEWDAFPQDILAGSFAALLAVGTVFTLSRYAIHLHSLDYFKEEKKDLRGHIASRSHILATTYKLSPREEEVLTLLAAGRNGPYITRELIISEGTYKTHCYRIYQKLGIHKNQELIDLINADEFLDETN
jgi:DNA-binding CsgD family transcriptional regulator